MITIIPGQAQLQDRSDRFPQTPKSLPARKAAGALRVGRALTGHAGRRNEAAAHFNHLHWGGGPHNAQKRENVGLAGWLGAERSGRVPTRRGGDAEFDPIIKPDGHEIEHVQRAGFCTGWPAQNQVLVQREVVET